MTTSLWIVLTAALIAVCGTIYSARAAMSNSQATLKQSLDIRMCELAEANANETEASRQSERSSNLAEAKLIREELKAGREEMRLDRDRIAKDLEAERARTLESEKFAQVERVKLRAEISELQAQQRAIETEREQKKAMIDLLKKQHAIEIAGYKRQLSLLTAKITKMEARIKELETREPDNPATRPDVINTGTI